MTCECTIYQVHVDFVTKDTCFSFGQNFSTLLQSYGLNRMFSYDSYDS